MTNLDQKVLIILTGGTIDSYYEKKRDGVVPNKNSLIPEYLRSLDLYIGIVYKQICMKDSRDLIKSDLGNILKTINKSKIKKILITHGTYTMVKTAKLLQNNLKRKDQTIILTGSMIPINGFINSDGQFNLGFALASFNYLKPGIYVGMNGKIFKPEAVKKDIMQGKFTSVFGEK